MISFAFKKVERRSFKYYPRYHKDDKQSKLSPFAKNYIEKRIDLDMENDALSQGKKFRFKRNLRNERQGITKRKSRINLILFIAVIAMLYGMIWIANNPESVYSFFYQWI